MYDAPIDEAECFDPGGDNDEIDDFLAIEVPTYIEEGYYDSEGDVIYLESLLSDDTTHNLSSEVFFNHEPQHDTFSPKSDPLHHKFTGELITIPPGIVREHEDYISQMSLLYGNSSSQSPENYHTIIESLPTSTTLVEDSDSNREEIDIFSGPDDSIPPGVESDFDSEEDIIDNLLNNDPIPEYERLTFDMEPNVLMINNVNEDECFDLGEVRLMLKLMIPSHLSLGFFFRISLTLRFLPYFSPPRMRTPFLTPASPLRAGGISSGWNFHEAFTLPILVLFVLVILSRIDPEFSEDSRVPDTEDKIKFMLDTQQFTYTKDMFRDTLQLPVETPKNPFVAPANIHTIEAFMNRVGYQGVVDKLFHDVLNRTHVDYAALLWWDFMNNLFQKKEAIQYPHFIKLIIADLMKKFPNIPKRLKEDYHSIKDDVPLIRETDDYKEYETVFMKVDVPMTKP
ncbi:hypothetical protein Tco_0596589 [Tanacetum coccineum]